jgi:hypothetical protein
MNKIKYWYDRLKTSIENRLVFLYHYKKYHIRIPILVRIKKKTLSDWADEIPVEKIYHQSHTDIDILEDLSHKLYQFEMVFDKDRKFKMERIKANENNKNRNRTKRN